MQQELAVSRTAVTNEQLELIKKTIAKDATNDELKLFFYDCERRGVHPLDKLIHFTKRKGKYTPITSIDFMRIRAAESGEYAGSDDPVFEEGINGFPKKATVAVWRLVGGQKCSFTATARWAEYAPSDLNDTSAFMWKKMAFTMLGKCAEALALRKGFPGQLQGLYAKEEMDQANGEPKMAPDQARAFVQQTIAALPGTSQPSGLPAKQEAETISADYQPYVEGDGEARFTLVAVEKKSGKAGEFRKVTWREGSANCFTVTEFATLDSLQPGTVVTCDIKRKGQYINIVRVKQSGPTDDQWDASLYVDQMPEDEYARS